MKNSGWIVDSTSELCNPVLIIPKGLPHENKGYRFAVDLRRLNARTKVSNIWFPNWEKCGQNSATPNIFRKLICLMDSGKCDYIHPAGTKRVSHANTEHFNIAFCQWASLQLQLHFSAGWKVGGLKKHNLLWQRVNIGDLHLKVHTSTKTIKDAKDGRRAI
jgi:hypothetical protein